jgi:hypothetical protein
MSISSETRVASNSRCGRLSNYKWWSEISKKKLKTKINKSNLILE